MYKKCYCIRTPEQPDFFGMHSPTNDLLPMASTPGRTDDKVMLLLKPPVLSYIRELKTVVKEDPDYLTFHSTSVVLHIKSLLSLGSSSADFGNSDREVVGWVKEAIVRLGSFEK